MTPQYLGLFALNMLLSAQIFTALGAHPWQATACYVGTVVCTYVLGCLDERRRKS